MIGQMLRALRQQHGRLRMIDDGDENRRRADRPHLGDFLHHRIGVMIAALRRHIRIGDAGRHLQRQPRAHTGVKLVRRQRGHCLRPVHYKNSRNALASAIG